MECGTATKLVNLCKTRWVARINALEVFYDLYPAVVNTNSIYHGLYCNPEVSPLATSRALP